MENHRLVQILKTFTKEEFSDFEKFVASPFHNEGRNYIPLLKQLKKFYPGFNGKSFTKENLFRKLYPGGKFKPALMDTMISRVMKLAEKFLLYSTLEKYEFEKSSMLMKEFLQRKLDKNYLKQLDESERILANESVFNIDFLENKRELETIKTDYLVQKDYFKFPESLLKRGDYVILSFVVKLIYSIQDLCLMGYELNLDTKNNLVESSSKLIDLKALIDLIKQSGNPYFYVIDFKYKELLAMMNLDGESYLSYKNLAYENMNMFNSSEKFNILGAMSSICIMGRRKGNSMFNYEMLEVCKKMLNEKSYDYSSDYADLSRYLNMLHNFVRYNEWEYFERLVSEFGSRLNPEYKESIINFSRMMRLFKEEKFEEALKYNKIDYNHSLLRYNARGLLMKIYYELDYVEELLSLLDSSQKFLKSIKHYSDANIKQTNNLIRYLRQIVLFKEKRNIKKLRDLQADLLHEEVINDKLWLESKIQEALDKSV